MTRTALAITLIFLSANYLRAQTCSSPGQTPVTAIVVCGGESFGQNSVPVCGVTNIPVPCNNGNIYENTDPYWYKISCYSAGSLGFIITPNDLNDNFDWQLFDITNRNPFDVFTNPSLFVACNWSSDPGETGASVDGLSLVVCGGPGGPLYSSMPDLVVGREYLLMVSNHSHSTNGFQIVFTGGNAGITDGAPVLLNARLSCDGLSVFVTFNKAMACSTLAADGSDFLINGATIIGASATNCFPGLTTDTVLLFLGSPIVSGNYRLFMRDGSDGNTLMDHCNRFIAAGNDVVFSAITSQPTVMDSITTPGCSPKTLQLVFSRPIKCSSVAPDGSDFIVTGPQNVVISGASNFCNFGETSFIKIQLAAPITIGGNYQIRLVNGSDGNTLSDQCERQIPIGSGLSFVVKDSVSADFSYIIRPSCRIDTLNFQHSGGAGIVSWNWNFDNSSTSNLSGPIKIFPAAGQHTVKLIVSNGGCVDTVSKNITLDNKVVAGFEVPDQLCPEDPINLVNTSSGHVDIWTWNFGTVNSSSLQTPLALHFPPTGRDAIYTIKLVATNTALNCKDSAAHTVRVLASCFIAVPSAFTPNGDGINDYLYPNNALRADNLSFIVYNRMGQLVFETKDWTRKWDGKVNGIPQDTGVYAWLLSFTRHDTGEKVFMKGTTVLIR